MIDLHLTSTSERFELEANKLQLEGGINASTLQTATQQTSNEAAWYVAEVYA